MVWLAGRADWLVAQNGVAAVRIRDDIVMVCRGVRADDYRKMQAEREERRRETDVAWRSGGVEWRAYVAFREKMKTNQEEKNEVKKMNESKMEKNEVKPMVSEAMAIDEKLTVTGLVAAVLAGEMQLVEVDGVMARGEWWEGGGGGLGVAREGTAWAEVAGGLMVGEGCVGVGGGWGGGGDRGAPGEVGRVGHV